MHGCEKIPKKTLFFLTVILIAVCILAAITFLHPLNGTTAAPEKTDSLVPRDETPGKTTTEIPRSVTIISVSQNPDTSIVRIAGWTTLPSGSEILFEIWPADIDVRKKNAGEVNGFSGKTSVFERNGSAAWSGEFDSSLWNAGEYIINAWPEESDPHYGDKKRFSLPLNDTIRNGAGTYSGNGEILLSSLSLSGTPGNPVSVTPLATPV